MTSTIHSPAIGVLVTVWATTACAVVPVHPTTLPERLAAPAPVRFDAARTKVTGVADADAAAQIAAHTAMTLNDIVGGPQDATALPTTVALDGRFEETDVVVATFTTTLASGAPVITRVEMRVAPEARKTAGELPARDRAFFGTIGAGACRLGPDLGCMLLGGALVPLALVVGGVWAFVTYPGTALLLVGIGAGAVLVVAAITGAFVVGRELGLQGRWSDAYVAALRLHGARVAAASRAVEVVE